MIISGRNGDAHGIFYGTHVQNPEIVKKFPTRGVGVLTVKGTENEGHAGDAPLADAVERGFIPLPDDIIAKLKLHDLEDTTIAIDLVGLIALVRNQFRFVHFPNKHNESQIVSLDLTHVVMRRLQREFRKQLLPRNTADWFGGGRWKNFPV